MNSDFSDFIRFFPIFRLFPTFRLLDSTGLAVTPSSNTRSYTLRSVPLSPRQSFLTRGYPVRLCPLKPLWPPLWTLLPPSHHCSGRSTQDRLFRSAPSPAPSLAWTGLISLFQPSALSLFRQERSVCKILTTRQRSFLKPPRHIPLLESRP